MKKVLFATTALVASAGFAAAEVSVSGWAEMGIYDNGATTAFFQDLDVSFKGTGTTDNGLTFGMGVDLDESVSKATLTCTGASAATCTLTNSFTAHDVNDDGGATIFVSGAFGTLTMGDTDGALDWALQEVNFAAGSIADDETEHAGFNGNSALDGTHDGQVLRYDYSFGAFAVAASLEIDDAGTADDVYGIGFKYTADLGAAKVKFGLGYQDAGTVDATGVSVDADFGNGFVAGISYMDSTVTDHIGVGVGYTMDALSIGVNYGEYGTGADGFGVAVNYDLGGGAVVQLGYGDGTSAAGISNSTWSFGLAMSF